MIDVRCFLDDYKVIKAYFYKPFDASRVNELKIIKNGVNLVFSINYEFETDEYYKFRIDLDKEFKYDDKLEMCFEKNTKPVIIRHLVSKPKFDEDFRVNLKTLGSFYSSEETTFRIWAPLANSVKVHLIDYLKDIEMNYVSKGVFECTIKGNFELCHYTYLINRYEEVKEVIDPFAYSSGPNAKYSIVLNQDKFIKDKYKPEYIMKNDTDAIIYELSVRDFTSIVLSNTKTHGKLISLCEDDTSFEGEPTGLAYIKSLGVTHIQMMPVFDFGSVDEIKQDSYNWGYDPMQYNVVDGTYTSNIYDAYARVNELRELVNVMHMNDIRVNLDVVFNHIYHSEEYSIENILPYYTFRYYNEEYLSNGSYCGNEIRSEAKFMHDYILLMCERYLDVFDIDGLRFDLMGLTDIDTMNDIKDLVKSKKVDFMIYGEGWDMPTILPFEKRSCINNSYHMQGIGFFNPHFRDVIKGSTMLSEVRNPGYVLGNLGLVNETKKALLGCVNDFGYAGASINYVECHDNMTFFDKAKTCLNYDRYENLKSRSKLAIALVLLSQGVPFIHSGQEFLRTKYGQDNTYNKGDYYNQMDYALRNQNLDVVNFTKDMIKIRKEYSDFRLNDKEEIDKNVFFDEYYGMLIYHAKEMITFINPSLDEYTLTIPKPIKVIYNKDQFDEVVVSSSITIKPLSVVIARNI